MNTKELPYCSAVEESYWKWEVLSAERRCLSIQYCCLIPYNDCMTMGAMAHSTDRHLLC